MKEIDPVAMKRETDKFILQIPVKDRSHQDQGNENTKIKCWFPKPYPVMKKDIKKNPEPQKQRTILAQECQSCKQTE
jgi:hypothetical protein